MFCFQCEQTAKGEGCTKIGVCGKQPDTAALQDLLIYTVKGLSQTALAAGEMDIRDRQTDRYTCEAVFSTLTNVDFDPDRFVTLIRKGADLRDQLKAKIKAAGGKLPAALEQEGPATFVPGAGRQEMVAQGEKVGIPSASKSIRMCAACANC